MDNLLIPFLSQLAAQAPALLVYLVGLILALVFLGRYPGPAALTLVAAGLLLLTSLAQPLLSLYLFRARAEFGWSDAQLGAMASANALAGSALRAVAFGLLLTAVFIGRRVRQGSGPGEPLQRPGPASWQSEEHGLTGPPGS
jgi:hypothetical protein